MEKQSVNPFLPSYEYIPDSEPYVFGDRLYIYGSHDRFNGKLFCMNDYVCWSAPIDDLTDWTYEGVIYRKVQDPKNRLGLYHMFAPDVTKGIDGRYYLYYTLGFRSIMGVAVCDTPNGSYEFYGYISFPNGERLWNKKGDPYLFDPAIFVDEDEKVYLYSGFAPKHGIPRMLTDFKKKTFKGGYVIELKSDMKTVKSEPKLLFPKVGEAEGTGFEGHEFFEASSIRKIHDTYYFIYSSINGHELCYATSKSPVGGFKFGGTIVSNGDLVINGFAEDEKAYNYIGNNHGSIVCVKGQWYVFYHRHTHRHHFSRQAVAEPIQIKEDGSIPQVEMTSSGLNNGPLLGSGEYEARIACHLMSKEGAGRYGTYFGNIAFRGHPYLTQTGKDREDTPTQYIANMQDGAVAGYKYFILKDVKGMAVNVKATGGGTMFVSTSLYSEPIASIPIKKTKEDAYFQTKVNLPNGKHALYFTYKGSGKVDFNSFALHT
ncbi:family 43 glycosylhydrolase [Salipaludibacillus agaradhaerens]|uniref:family 43 glycosylhydrolase n=1 Tax=Salipaludibacillus agaradhaerens TaxID=76935 RepID=UPI0009960621|nr:family 43 glycosylhydrolase [Salipaludibacillus agaradhaerens]